MTREEAIKTIRLTCPKISDSECDFETAMRFLIPELRESEDERIRKYFIWIVKNVFDNIQRLKLSKEQTRELIDNYNGIKVSDMLHWLEKQKEPVVDKEGMYYYLGGKFIYCGYPATEENPYDFAMSQQEKQKEEEGYEAIPVESTLEYKLGFKAGKESEKQEGKMTAEEYEKSELFQLKLKTKYANGYQDGLAQKEQEEIPLMNGDADLYFDNWRQKVPVPTFRQCFEEGIRYAQRLQKEPKNVSASTMIPSCWAEEPSLQEEQKPVEFPLKDKVFSIMKKLNSLNFMLKLGSNEERLVNEITSEVRDLADYSIDKPAEWSEEDKIKLDNCCAVIAQQETYFDISLRQKCLDFLYELPKRFNIQPKQEWNEEDEKIIDTIVSVLGQYIDYKAVSGTGSGYATPRYSKEMDWLKSLPLNLKKKNEDVAKPCSNEWSEEEYGRLFDIEHYLDGTLQLSPDRKIACIDFLKSLHPSWKPSEEQMEALNALNCHGELSYVGQQNQLISLQNDLEKLMKI